MDLKQGLNASEAASVQQLRLYLPDRDKQNRPVSNIQDWIDAAVALFVEINGGCTALPPSDGAWRTDAGPVVSERTAVVYSYITDPDEFERQFDKIARFVHLFGKRTGPESVMVEFSGGEEGKYISRAYFVNEKDYL